MSSTTEPSLLQPAPQPPQPHRPPTSCDRHPEEHFTGFCPLCLCERLSLLDSSSFASSSRKPPSTATSAAVEALKAIFKPSSSSSSSKAPAFSSSAFFPELRRTKSFSASKNEGFSGGFEPQRRSCDVRVRSSLWSLFTQEERNPRTTQNPNRKDPTGFGVGPTSEIVEIEPPRVSSSSLARVSTSSLPPPVFEEEEEEEEEEEVEDKSGFETLNDNVVGGEPESNGLVTARSSNARPVKEIIEEGEEEEAKSNFETRNDNVVGGELEFKNLVSARSSNTRPVEEIVEEEEDRIVIEPEDFEGDRVEEEEVEEEMKPMKDHIELDAQEKKRDLKEIAGSFWSAASVFSKKLQKWRQKQKVKKQRREELRGGGSVGRLPVEKPIGRQFRETQSEVADYGFGRRSCDTDPRFSLDVGRVSFEDQLRYSFDEPRASWDGHLMGPRLSYSGFTKMPTMVEDHPVNDVTSNINGIVNGCSGNNVVVRSDGQIPVEEDDGVVPGGSVQTREYYLDSSSRRKRSFDRSSSIRKTSAAVVAETDERKNVSNLKVSPAVAAAEDFHGLKLADRDLGELRDSGPLRDDCSGSFEMGYMDNGGIVGNGERKVGTKKSWRWGRGIWGFIYRRSVNKDEDEDGYSRSNSVVERSFSESWQESRRGNNGDVKSGVFNPKVLRSNSSNSWRSSNGFVGVGPFGGSARKSNVETNGNSRKKRDEFVLERNASARYSPNSIDNGMLRFYLTPLRGSQRVGWGKGESNRAHSIARSILRLY